MHFFNQLIRIKHKQPFVMYVEIIFPVTEDFK